MLEKLGQCVVIRNLNDLTTFELTPVVAFDIETSGHNGLPGDCPYTDKHGIMGMSLCNMYGDAVYIVTNDSRNYEGVPIQELVTWLNQNLQGKIVVTHNGKFDFGFFLSRGLVMNFTWYDTQVMTVLTRKGVFTSNRLKDIVKEKFGIEPKTESAKDEFFDLNGTKDYGDLPIELVAPYACDDVRYTLMIYGSTTLTEEEWKLHDLYVSNYLHCIDCEKNGFSVDIETMSEAVDYFTNQHTSHGNVVRESLGSAAVDYTDEQKFLQYLHDRGAHPEMRDLFGEKQFVYDDNFLSDYDGNQLVHSYRRWYLSNLILNIFNSDTTELKVFSSNNVDGSEDVRMHLDLYPSMFSKGGVVECKNPQINHDLFSNKSANRQNSINYSLRKLFKARAGSELVIVKAPTLKWALLAQVIDDTEMQEWLSNDPSAQNFLNRVAVKASLGLKDHAKAMAACGLMLEQITDGFGYKLLDAKMTAEGIKTKASKDHFKIRDKFVAAFPALGQFSINLKEILVDNAGLIEDNVGRTIFIPQDKTWRATAILLQSSWGSSLAKCFNIFCNLAKTTNARPVFANHAEFVFEVPTGDTCFKDFVASLDTEQLGLPKFVFEVKQTEHWD